MILYIGNEEDAQFLNGQFQESIFCERASNPKDLNYAFNKAKENAYNYIFIDLKSILAQSQQIIAEIQSLQEINHNAQIIVVAEGYDKRSVMIKQLEQAHIYNVINAELDGDKIQQLQEILHGKNIPITEIENEIPEEIEPKLQNNKIKIGVVGCCNRIGTTTQCLQILQYLRLCKKKACYVELNNKHFIDSISVLYNNLEIDNGLQKIRCNRIDFFKDFKVSNEYIDENYEYVVFDYGQVDDFNITSFLEKDIQIVIGGFSSTEIQSMMRIFENKLMSNKTKWIFSFIADNMKDEIKSSMLQFEDQTYFAPYQPDMFFLNPNKCEIYEQILSLTPPVENKKKKKGFFFHH